VVDDAWKASAYLDQNGLASRLGLVHDSLHRWDRTVLKKSQNKINSVKRELEELTRSDLTEENIREKELAMEIEKLLEQEEMYWAQRSRVNWLQFGDKNTNFFHNFASSRRKRNKIKNLKNLNGDILEGKEQLNPHISGYFAVLFTTEVEEPDPALIQLVTPRVVEEMMQTF
jgi:hypothetical protein